MGALTDLVEAHEDAHVVIPPTTGVEALRNLMEENELAQVGLVSLFGTASVTFEVLAGKCRLALAHIKRLAAHFGLPADVFIGKSVEGSQEQRRLSDRSGIVVGVMPHGSSEAAPS